MRKLHFFIKKKGELPRGETKIVFLLGRARAKILQWWEPGEGEAKSKFRPGAPTSRPF
jgi:hypothetical protein